MASLKRRKERVGLMQVHVSERDSVPVKQGEEEPEQSMSVKPRPQARIIFGLVI